MAIDFPNSPTNGDTFTVSGRTWTWNGISWKQSVSAGPQGVQGPSGTGRMIQSDSTPATPIAGDVWFNSTNGNTYLYYDGYWISWGQGAQGPQGPQGFQGVASTVAGPQGAQGDWSTAQAINVQTGVSYTLVASDAGKLITFNNASGINLTVPQDSVATIAVGVYVDLLQLGTAQVTTVAGGGATLRVSGITAKSRAQYSRFGVQKIAANTWSLFGDLAGS